MEKVPCIGHGNDRHQERKVTLWFRDADRLGSRIEKSDRIRLKFQICLHNPIWIILPLNFKSWFWSLKVEIKICPLLPLITVSSQKSRRMFPTLAVSVADLSPSASYSLMVDLNPVDKKRYRYSFHQSKWIATGPGSKEQKMVLWEWKWVGEAELPSRVFVHPDSPANGLHWMRSSVSFDKIKLTNNQLDQSGHVSPIFIYLIDRRDIFDS